MISYQGLWEMMKKKSATTYTLRQKGRISGSTLIRLQNGDSVSTQTLNSLCKLFGCAVSDLIEYIPDDEDN